MNWYVFLEFLEYDFLFDILLFKALNILFSSYQFNKSYNKISNINIESCCYSVTQSCLTLCDPMDCSTPGFPCSSFSPRTWSKLMSTESGMPSNHLILCHPLLLLPSILPSIRVFLMSWLFASGGQSIGASTYPSFQ